MDCSPSRSGSGPPPEIVLETEVTQDREARGQGHAVITQTQDDAIDYSNSQSNGTDVTGNEVSACVTCAGAFCLSQFYLFEFHALLSLRPTAPPFPLSLLLPTLTAGLQQFLDEYELPVQWS